MVDTRGGEFAKTKEPEILLGYKGRVIGSASRDDISITFADPECGTGGFLQCAQSARMIGVRVRVEQYFDIGNVEAKFRDAGHNRRRRFRITAIDQDMTFGPGDQERGDAGVANIVEIASDVERLIGQPAVFADRRSPERTKGTENDYSPE
jgi:hypothetical protein